MNLSYCFISNIDGRNLPFGREVVIIEDMEPVIQKFLVGCIEDVISLNECEIVGKDEIHEEALKPLQVCVAMLP